MNNSYSSIKPPPYQSIEKTPEKQYVPSNATSPDSTQRISRMMFGSPSITSTGTPTSKYIENSLHQLDDLINNRKQELSQLRLSNQKKFHTSSTQGKNSIISSSSRQSRINTGNMEKKEKLNNKDEINLSIRLFCDENKENGLNNKPSPLNMNLRNSPPTTIIRPPEQAFTNLLPASPLSQSKIKGIQHSPLENDRTNKLENQINELNKELDLVKLQKNNLENKCKEIESQYNESKCDFAYSLQQLKSKSQKVNEMEIEIESLISKKFHLENQLKEKSIEILNNSNINNNNLLTNYHELQDKYNQLEFKFNEVLNHSNRKDKELDESNIKKKNDSTRINMLEIEKKSQDEIIIDLEKKIRSLNDNAVNTEANLCKEIKVIENKSEKLLIRSAFNTLRIKAMKSAALTAIDTADATSYNRKLKFSKEKNEILSSINHNSKINEVNYNSNKKSIYSLIVAALVKFFIWILIILIAILYFKVQKLSLEFQNDRYRYTN